MAQTKKSWQDYLGASFGERNELRVGPNALVVGGETGGSVFRPLPIGTSSVGTAVLVDLIAGESMSVTVGTITSVGTVVGMGVVGTITGMGTIAGMGTTAGIGTVTGMGTLAGLGTVAGVGTVTGAGTVGGMGTVAGIGTVGGVGVVGTITGIGNIGLGSITNVGNVGTITKLNGSVALAANNGVDIGDVDIRSGTLNIGTVVSGMGTYQGTFTIGSAAGSGTVTPGFTGLSRSWVIQTPEMNATGTATLRLIDGLGGTFFQQATVEKSTAVYGSVVALTPEMELRCICDAAQTSSIAVIAKVYYDK